MVFLLCGSGCVSEEHLVWHMDGHSKYTNISLAFVVSSLLFWVS